LVLQLFGHRDPERVRRSDATCTALQLANFWQDIAVDWTKNRVYLPQEDLDHFGVTEAQIAAGEVDDRWRALMRFEVARARALFSEGLPLRDMVRGRLRLVLAAFSRGGMAICDAIERVRYDVFHRRPENTKALFKRQALREAIRLTALSPLWWTR
ncbi:MAG: squalene/phytoene synthase family protein, partial [Planctomycetota bacterium]